MNKIFKHHKPYRGLNRVGGTKSPLKYKDTKEFKIYLNPDFQAKESPPIET